MTENMMPQLTLTPDDSVAVEMQIGRASCRERV